MEDLHWADTASLELLRFLVDRLPDRRLMILLAHRNTTIGRKLTRGPRSPAHEAVLNAPATRAAAQRKVDGQPAAGLDEGDVHHSTGWRWMGTTSGLATDRRRRLDEIIGWRAMLDYLRPAPAKTRRVIHTSTVGHIKTFTPSGAASRASSPQKPQFGLRA